MTPKKEHLEKCGGTTLAGHPCKNPAGLRTSHPGTGKCYKHGGASDGAPKGNKNAVATGEYETLHVSALTDAERGLYDALDVDPRSQAEGTIRLLSIREHRIMLRIRRVMEADEDGFEISSISTIRGWQPKGKVDTTQVDRTSTLETIQRLEDALTRVQGLKVRAIEQLRAVAKENPPDSGGLTAIVEAINRSAKKIAAQKEAEG